MKEPMMAAFGELRDLEATLSLEKSQASDARGGLSPYVRQVGRDLAALHLAGVDGHAPAQRTKSLFEQRAEEFDATAEGAIFYRAALWAVAELLGGYEQATQRDAVEDERDRQRETRQRESVWNALCDCKAGVLRPRELSVLLRIDKSQVSRTLRQLEDEGLAEVAPAPPGSDRRSRYWRAVGCPTRYGRLPEPWQKACDSEEKIEVVVSPSEGGLEPLTCALSSRRDYLVLESLMAS